MTKLTLALILFFIISKSSIGQFFSFNELVALAKNNIDYFDTYVTKKGYEYFDVEQRNSAEKRSYSFGRDSYSNKAKYWISFIQYAETSDEICYVSWSTDRKHYINIKEQMQANGFKFLKTEKSDDKVYNVYKKGKIQIQLWLGTISSTDGNKQNNYEIDVSLFR